MLDPRVPGPAHFDSGSRESGEASCGSVDVGGCISVRRQRWQPLGYQSQPDGWHSAFRPSWVMLSTTFVQVRHQDTDHADSLCPGAGCRKVRFIPEGGAGARTQPTGACRLNRRVLCESRGRRPRGCCVRSRGRRFSCRPCAEDAIPGAYRVMPARPRRLYGRRLWPLSCDGHGTVTLRPGFRQPDRDRRHPAWMMRCAYWGGHR